ncbi:hypothetical protein [Marinisporobacter balticus]|uniref:Uncharacterized protein n=1 Tax=Marinisporobacter balticus TaxID=2018667 RepID=A0A4R2LIH1_9FIRM|nr:hypothetical protein [Marinisporobacter balticus]TCO79125.1 hypothetical protein EV214_103177 [Marinisporobacter balticus]
MIGIEKTGFRVACDTQNCRKPTKWIVGNLAFKHTCINLCDDCKAELTKQLAGDITAAEEELKEKLHVAEVNELERQRDEALAANKITPIEKKIFDCVKVDGRISKADLVKLGEEHGVKIDESMKVSEIFKALEGETE